MVFVWIKNCKAETLQQLISDFFPQLNIVIIEYDIIFYIKSNCGFY